MCNGGEGRTLKPCCDAALASSRYISNGPAKAHSLPTLPSALPPLNPSLPGPPRLALAGLPPSFASTRSPFPSPSSPGPIALARSLARARASVDDSCPRSPPSTFLGPKSPCGGDAWAGGGIREALYKSPGYRLTRAHSFSPLLPPPTSLPLCHSSSTFPVSSSATSFSSPFVPPRVSSSFFISLASVLLNRKANSCYISFIYRFFPPSLRSSLNFGVDRSTFDACFLRALSFISLFIPSVLLLLFSFI